VNRCIDMGAAIFGHLQAIRGIVIPARRLPCLLGNEMKVLFSRPDNRVRPEGMSEINEPGLFPVETIKSRRASSTSHTSQQAEPSQPARYLPHPLP
jgi:hypothetical protein